MRIFRKIIIHLVIGFVSIIFLFGTLFIEQPSELLTRRVHLGYPIHFYNLDFSGNQGGTHMSGASDEVIAKGRFNILSAWEEFGRMNWLSFILSYLIIFSVIEIIAILFMQLRTSKK